MIHLDAQALMEQAATTADYYMQRAVSAITHQFGIGYAKDNPQLVAAFMEVAARDYNTAYNNVTMGEFADALSKAITRRADDNKY